MTCYLQGLHFQSVHGNHYYYDNCSGLCFPCPDEFRKTLLALEGVTLESLQEKTERSYWENFLLKRHAAYGAFFGARILPENLARPDPEIVRQALDFARMRMLYLVVTNECNLRCKYCIFSGHYDTPTYSSDRMTWDTAKSAVDYFMHCLQKKRTRKPDEPFVITFYGGEPLLHFDLIRRVVAYVRESDDNVVFSLTTNGVLLDDEKAAFLVKNKFSIAISLDGPQPEHDRNRVFPNGSGSFQCIERNLNRFWERYPDYDYIVYIVTCDVASDIGAIRRYFASNPQFAKGTLFFSKVKDTFTDYYNQFSQEQIRQYVRQGKALRNAVLEAKNEDDPVVAHGASAPYFMYLMRKLFGPVRGPLIPATGSCIPGEKICVMPNGEFQICERVPGLCSLGDVKNGLDFEKISGLIWMYNDSITKNCANCPILRLCSFCMLDFWSGKRIEKPSSNYCTTKIETVRNMLADLYSQLEEDDSLANRITYINDEKLKRLQAFVA